jgi:hypothetical protein
MAEELITGAVAGALLGGVAKDAIETVRHDFVGDPGLDYSHHHLRQQTSLLAQILAAAHEANKTITPQPHGEFISFTASSGYDVSGLERQHISIFTTAAFPLLIRTPLGDTTYSMNPGWNALDPPPGARLHVGAGGPTAVQAYVYWSDESKDIEYTGPGGSGGGAPDYTSLFNTMITDLAAIAADVVASNTALATSNTNLVNLLNGLQSATRAEVVTPSDAVNLTRPSRQLYVGTAGDVALVTLGGDTLTIPGVPDGSLLNIQATRINATNTNADLMVSFA